ncbi:Ig-like domain-containing protein [Vibrio jasicida]|uniref:Ig-like domain-containing protein n=1 Tax=Vibrio jasicida TaxID=766224 RepID=UPI0040682674
MRVTCVLKAIFALSLIMFGLSGCHNGVKDLVVTQKDSRLPAGLQLQLKAEKVFSQGDVVDVTVNEDVEWRSSDEQVATVDSNGLVSAGDAAGVVKITAVGIFDGKEFEDEAVIEVTNAVVTAITVSPKGTSVPAGLTRAYTVTANFSNGQSIDVTKDRSINWESDDNSVATVSNEKDYKGLVTSKIPGIATITARLEVGGEQFQDSTSLNVTEAIVTGLELNPKQQSIFAGLERQFSAALTMSDGKTLDVTNDSLFTWSTSDSKIASVSDDVRGLVTAVSEGAVKISVTGQLNGEPIYGETELVVTEGVIESLSVVPEFQTVPVGLEKSFKAYATLSNGKIVDVTRDSEVSWSSGNSELATISNSLVNKGNATGVAIGEVAITAFVEVNGQQITGVASLAVNEAVVERLLVTPKPQESLETPQIPSGEKKQFKAEAFMSDGTLIDVTNSEHLYWSSEDEGIATVSNSLGQKGLATGEDVGTSLITAKLFSGDFMVEDSSEFTVTQPHSLSFYVLSGLYDNEVQDVPIHYIGYAKGVTGRYGHLGSLFRMNKANTPRVNMSAIYLVGQRGTQIDAHSFIFTPQSSKPILGALKYKATFTWPNQTTTKGSLVWDFIERTYVLVNPKPAQNLLDHEWNFTVTVSNDEDF